MGTLMTIWDVINIVLTCVIVGASLSFSRRRYWISVYSFTCLSVGVCYFAVFPMAFGINIANAFGPRPVSLLVYIPPLLTVGWFAYSALSLYPFISGRTSFWLVTSISGLTVLYSLSLFVYIAIRNQLSGGPPPYLGIQAIYYWLLWMRIYDLRKEVCPVNAILNPKAEPDTPPNRP